MTDKYISYSLLFFNCLIIFSSPCEISKIRELALCGFFGKEFLSVKKWTGNVEGTTHKN